jgi:hypothetical protein
MYLYYGIWHWRNQRARFLKSRVLCAALPGGDADISALTKDRLTAGGREIPEAGIWQRLFGGEIREHEAEVYGRTVSGGGIVLSVRVPDIQVPMRRAFLTSTSRSTSRNGRPTWA